MGAETAPAYGGARAQMLGNGLKRDPRAPLGPGTGRAWRISAAVSGGNALKRRDWHYGSLDFRQGRAAPNVHRRPPSASVWNGHGHGLALVASGPANEGAVPPAGRTVHASGQTTFVHLWLSASFARADTPNPGSARLSALLKHGHIHQRRRELPTWLLDKAPG